MNILFTVMTFLSLSENLTAAEDLSLACTFKQPAVSTDESDCREKLNLNGFNIAGTAYKDAIVGQNKILEKKGKVRILNCDRIESFCVAQNSKADIKTRADDLRNCLSDFEDNGLGNVRSNEIQNLCIIALDKMAYREIRRCFAKSKKITLQRYDQIQDLEDGVSRLIGLGTDENVLMNCLSISL